MKWEMEKVSCLHMVLGRLPLVMGLIPLSLQLSQLSQLQLSTWESILLSLGLNEGPCWE